MPSSASLRTKRTKTLFKEGPKSKNRQSKVNKKLNSIKRTKRRPMNSSLQSNFKSKNIMKIVVLSFRRSIIITTYVRSHLLSLTSFHIPRYLSWENQRLANLDSFFLLKRKMKATNRFKRMVQSECPSFVAITFLSSKFHAVRGTLIFYQEKAMCTLWVATGTGLQASVITSKA